jgi:septum formation protein
MFDIYLASQSPRRAELLSILNVRFKQFSVDIDETVWKSERPIDYINSVTNLKMVSTVKRVGDNKPVLVADTIVVIDGLIMGKPVSFEESKRMLSMLSGRVHQVITMISVSYKGNVYSSISKSDVKFRAIACHEIEAYWKTGEPQDKAGSYGIQGLGSIFIEKIEGSYTAIMGMPHFEVSDLLGKCGITILGKGVT